jgi:acetyl-CoA carboxylase beta subunit
MGDSYSPLEDDEFNVRRLNDWEREQLRRARELTEEERRQLALDAGAARGRRDDLHKEDLLDRRDAREQRRRLHEQDLHERQERHAVWLIRQRLVLALLLFIVIAAFLALTTTIGEGTSVGRLVGDLRPFWW